MFKLNKDCYSRVYSLSCPFAFELLKERSVQITINGEEGWKKKKEGGWKESSINIRHNFNELN